MIVPRATGSAGDLAARIVAAMMSIVLGQSIVIENVAGAAGIIGAQRVARAAHHRCARSRFNACGS